VRRRRVGNKFAIFSLNFDAFPKANEMEFCGFRVFDESKLMEKVLKLKIWGWKPWGFLALFLIEVGRTMEVPAGFCQFLANFLQNVHDDSLFSAIFF
jgi:hypothetical protein